ncbi:MAG: addiction module component, family protein [Gammaproteobacteria bacterium]|nr:MAG: addiction module component, family protein [Gammaproteobacteria bacterium]
MSKTATELLHKALTLDENDRASIAGALIESLHGKVEPGIDATWEQEIKRRISELDTHAVKTIPWSEVRERLFRGYE